MIQIVAVILGLFLTTPALTSQPVPTTEHVHLHAGFQIYNNDVREDFTDIKYIYFMPCGLPDDQIATVQDKVHLHDQVGDVAHIHAAGVTWRDLLTSLNYPIPDNGIFYLGNQEQPNLLDMPIESFASASMFFGNTSNIPEKLTQQVTRERIEEIDKQTGENCGTAETQDHAATTRLAA